jgi:DNA polymerase I-like protein with 3'-5' exonuclease and polymerase domains
MMAEHYAVIDVETTIRGPRRSPSPFYPENMMVMASALSDKSLPGPHGLEEHVTFTTTEQCREFVPALMAANVGLLVGHNIGFDLHWCMRECASFQQYLGKHCRIWDTQLAEYLLSGQVEVMTSLNHCALTRGGTLKDTRVSDLWAAGVDTTEIDPTILADYLKQDVINTHIVFESQVAEAIARNMLPLIWSQMEALQATIDMTFNGLRLDSDKVHDLCHVWETEVAALEENVKTAADVVRDWADFNPASPAQLATILYGGEREFARNEVVGTYKTGPRKGTPKTKRVTTRVKVEAWLPTAPTQFTPSGAPAVHDAALAQALDQAAPGSSVHEFLKDMRDLRAVRKQLSTYGHGLLEKMYPDGYIHHRLNHTVARTGRLTSSDPNLQNVTNGPIKAAFRSRYKNGKLIEADYAQLEMVALAYLSGDARLTADIQLGLDMHTELFRDMHGRAPTSEERKRFKRQAFGLVYGAGAAKIAEGAGVSVAEASEFITTFYARYPDVKEWHEDMYEIVTDRGIHTGHLDTDGTPIRTSVYESCTGRHYVFREYDAPEWMKERLHKPLLKTFSPTEVKNYFVQGLATGDIVPLAVGQLYRALYASNLKGTRLINTVHDSVMLDSPDYEAAQAAVLTRQVLKNTPAAFEKVFGKPFPLPLNVGVSWGPNWLDQSAFEATDAVTADTNQDKDQTWHELTTQ